MRIASENLCANYVGTSIPPAILISTNFDNFIDIQLWISIKRIPLHDLCDVSGQKEFLLRPQSSKNNKMSSRVEEHDPPIVVAFVLPLFSTSLKLQKRPIFKWFTVLRKPAIFVMCRNSEKIVNPLPIFRHG